MGNLIDQAEVIMAHLQAEEHKSCFEDLIKEMKENGETEEDIFHNVWCSGWVHGLNFATEAILEGKEREEQKLQEQAQEKTEEDTNE